MELTGNRDTNPLTGRCNGSWTFYRFRTDSVGSPDWTFREDTVAAPG